MEALELNMDLASLAMLILIGQMTRLCWKCASRVLLAGLPAPPALGPYWGYRTREAAAGSSCHF